MKQQALPGKAGPPAHEQVYQQVRDMILFGDLSPGQAVTIQGLTSSLQSGMTPVREALRRLTSEGALAFLGNRRIVVPQLDAATLAELAFARNALEPELARRACPRITPADIDRLIEIDTEIDKGIQDGNIQAYLKGNYDFHAELHARAASPVLLQHVDMLWLRFGPSLRVVCGQYGVGSGPDNHKALIQALQKNDPGAAAAAIHNDIHQGMDEIRSALAAEAL